MNRWWIRCAAAVALLFAAAPAGASAPRSGGSRGGVPVLKVGFHAAGIASILITGQRYAFAAPVNLESSGTLFDDQTGRRLPIHLGGCAPAGSVIFGQVLAFDCWHPLQQPLRLYSITSATWQAITPGPDITACQAYMGVCPWQLTAAGSSWLEINKSTCEMDDHCTFENLFQNIRTGDVVNDPAVQGGHQIGDVDAPQLVQRLCSPLTVPPGFNIFSAPGPGPIQLDGRFAIASRPGPQGGSEAYLEECGTHLLQLLAPYRPAEYASPVASNRHALVWQTRTDSLSVEFLPSRRRFLVPLPKAVQGYLQPALTDRRLYVLQGGYLNENERLWTASFPSKPPTPESRHRR